ncbi:hypothetical protein A2Y85_00295 [candidate division WOR-3 bacterium RBG_13_43_14]|uniref:Phosphate acetyl/butaryl transferase domain-containing protein n=1 Tax=candidate division WOR-3 bacterium RBG_13_43_14 TaxID=1802590 RepID=A0A1F4U2R7_UNCW3|nr:MAG: hypothetical protein A2Y85_00295 [candidate division WOR-3 bacterium RBG_13_43_14]
MRNFQELIHSVKGKGKKNCVVVKAEDETVLDALRIAQHHGLIEPVLYGNKENIIKHAKNVHLDISKIIIHDVPDENEAMHQATLMVKQEGDFIMKGLLSTTVFLKGILNKDWGLRTGKILSHIAVLSIPGYHKLLFMSDGGMNPKLDLKTRIDIINNAIETLKALGISKPKIALVAASETVNPDMPETTDAIQIVEMARAGQISDCIIDGPFGFDVAISKNAAEHKKIVSEIAGDTDFILMPNISAANIWAKGLMFFANTKGAGMVAGAMRPVIMLSRADDAETKLNSIALGVAISAANK